MASIGGIYVICCTDGMVEFYWGTSYGMNLNNSSKASSRDVSESRNCSEQATASAPPTWALARRYG